MPKAPRRPSAIPAAAVWNAEQDEWELGNKKGTKEIGESTWWRADGSLACKSTFDAKGKLDGMCRRFHPDGSPSMEGRYVHGDRWGKTRHTRSLKGDSPEDLHMAEIPSNAFELALTFVADETSPMLNAMLTKKGVQSPPKSRLGVLEDLERDWKVFSGHRAARDWNRDRHRRTHLRPRCALLRRLRDERQSLGSFCLRAAEERTSDVPPWQDPDYGTVLGIEEVRTKLVVAVDYLDALIAPGRRLSELGFDVEPEKNRVTVRGLDPKGPAKKAGLRVGDVIEKMNGKTVKGLLDYVEARVEAASSRRATLNVVRAQRNVTIAISAPLEK